MAFFAENFDSEEVKIIQGDIDECEQAASEAFDNMFADTAHAFNKMFNELWEAKS